RSLTAGSIFFGIQPSSSTRKGCGGKRGAVQTASLEDPGATPTWAELLGAPRTAGRGGRGDAWGGKETVETIKAEIRELAAHCTAALAEHWAPRLAVVISGLTPVVRAHAAERRRHGTLQFHDQLVLARRLLQDDAVRRRVRERYTRILIDEFQDTDPIQ